MTTLNRETTLRDLAAETSDRLRAAGVLCPDGDGVGHALLSLHTAIVRVQYTAAVIIALDLAHNYAPQCLAGAGETITVGALSRSGNEYGPSELHYWTSALAAEWAKVPFPRTEDTAPTEHAIIVLMLLSTLTRALWDATTDPVRAVRVYAPEHVYLPVRAC